MTFLSETTFPELVKKLKSMPGAQEFLLTCTIDLLLHPLHIAETRFIAQNRKPNFSIYSGLLNFYRRSYSEIFRGILMHIPRNFFIALTGMRMHERISLTDYYLTTILF